MASDPMVSHSCHGRMEDVPRGTTQWLTWWHSLTSTTHLVCRELQRKWRQTRKQPN